MKRDRRRHRQIIKTWAWIGLISTLGCGASQPDEPGGPSATTVGQPGRTGGNATQEGAIETAVFNTPHGPVSLTYQIKNGQRVYQGDIILPPDQPDYRSGGVSSLANRWPNGIVPFESTGLFNDARVTAAIAHWQERLPLVFVGGATTGNRLRFIDLGNNQCSSFVGLQNVGAQDVNLAPGCGTGAAIHEIGHAIGLFHEQSRTDRNNFVTVIPGCIQSGMAFNFAVFGSAGINIGPYDIDSIMHYNSNFFLDTTIPGCTATIVRADNGQAFFLPRNELTGGDIAGADSLYKAWTVRRQPVDYDLDGKADLVVWRPSTRVWFFKRSSDGGTSQVQMGDATDIPMPMKWDGDNIPDKTVFRPSTGMWFTDRSGGGGPGQVQWGAAEDIPASADFDHDGRWDFVVFRPSDGNWFIMRSSNGATSATQWGVAGDVPVLGDYDGDTTPDLAVWRPSTGVWHIVPSGSGSPIQVQWGVATDYPVPGDFDGDGETDLAVWRRSTGVWHIVRSSDNSATQTTWGAVDDVPVPADYDGDGKTDVAVWRPSDGNWFIISSVTGAASVTQWGTRGDVPIP
jgi:hypothetical protein